MSIPLRLDRWRGAVALALLVLYVSGVSVRVYLFARTPALAEGFLDDYGLLIAFSMCAVVGALLVWKRPDHPLGWVMSAVGLIVAVLPGLESYAGYRMTTVGEPDAVATLGAWFNGWYWIPLLSLVLFYTPLYFPDGRLPSPRWRWVARAVTVGVVGASVPGMFVETLAGQDVDYVIANPVGVAGFTDWDSSMLFTVFSVTLVVGIVVAIASVVVRFRRSHGVERQQIKWLLLGVSPGPILPLVESMPGGEVLFLVNLAGIPLAISVAVLRYRLYDVDRIISRTLGYVLVSAILVGLYAAGVLSLGAIGRTATGEVNELVVALSTLLVAAAFQPLRRRVQSVVDRRFNRARYDAARTSEWFAQRVRDQVDLGHLRDDLGDTVRGSVAPATMSVWLRQETA